MSTDKEFPLFPELTEDGKKEAQAVMDNFKAALMKAAGSFIEEASSEFYTNVIQHVESDSWANFRNELLDGLTDYRNQAHAEYDYAKIRRAMFEEYRAEIIQDMNQDLVKEIDSLKEHIKFLQERR